MQRSIATEITEGTEVKTFFSVISVYSVADSYFVKGSMKKTAQRLRIISV